MASAYLLAGARTPIGKLCGSLAELDVVALGGRAVACALERAGIDAAEVDHVVMGQVLQAGQGQATARQAAVLAGVPMSVPATTLNRVCLSGSAAVHLADLMVRAGEASIVVAGGMESMTGAPYLLSGARTGLRFGNGDLRDAIMADGLSCAYQKVSMGEATDRDSGEAGITRDEQDHIALLSHQRAVAAAARLSTEIVPVQVPRGGGDDVEVAQDEGPRPGASAEALSVLRPVFRPEGTVTAGNASQISDGAAALVVVSEAVLERLGRSPLAEVVSCAQVAGPGPSLLGQPSLAARAAIEKAGLRVGDIDLFEVNEAFASVVVASLRELSVPEDIVNVNGGAIALGHPIGMSGARLALTLAYELKRRGGGVGVAALCGGGGQGDAIALRASPSD